MSQRVRRAVRWLIVLATPAVVAGCYGYSYLASAPTPGMRVVMDLTDVGRVQLADHVGTGIMRIEGRLVSFTDSIYSLRVERTIGLRGDAATWNGELVRINAGWVGLTREKRFSGPRTALLAGSVTAALVGFLATHGLIGGAQGGGIGPIGPELPGQ